MNDVISHFRNGGLVMICDNTDRENEGDFVLAAEFATPQNIQFITRNSSGILCIALTKEIAVKSGLQVMSKQNNDPNQTNFAVSVDAESCTTGVSAQDKVNTILELCKEKPVLRSPGHMFPLIAKDQLLIERKGHTEASVVLCKLAGCSPVAVIAEASNDDGTMMSREQCVSFGKEHNIPVITVEQLEEEYKCIYEPIIDSSHILSSSCTLPIDIDGCFEVSCTVYKHALTGEELVCVHSSSLCVKSNVRVHSECFTAHVLQSLRCDCGDQLHQFLRVMKREGGTLFFVNSHEGRGIGLLKKIEAYDKQQKESCDTFEANRRVGCKEECRDYSFVKEVMRKRGMRDCVLHTNNPKKANEFKEFVREVMEMDVKVHEHNQTYLEAKREKEGHTIRKSEMCAKSIDRGLTFSTKFEGEFRIAVISTQWNRVHMDAFWGVMNAYNKECDGKIVFTEYIVPGAFEIPAAVSNINQHKFDAILCLGVVIKGETMHFEYICESVFPAIMKLTMKSVIPVINGVLAVFHEEQLNPRYSLAKGWLQSALMMGKTLNSISLNRN